MERTARWDSWNSRILVISSPHNATFVTTLRDVTRIVTLYALCKARALVIVYHRNAD